jgi:hypothetical protein
MKELRDLTKEQIEYLQEQMKVVRNRVDKRRIGEEDGDEVPPHWKFHQFKYRTSNTMILLTVDGCTSGRWAYCVRGDWVAFEDEADMTMFMLAYIEPTFKPARLV